MTQAQHLTDAQFAECLAGDLPTPRIGAHLAACDDCRAQLALFQTSVEDFSIAALGWSKAQSQPSPRAQASPRAGFRPPAHPAHTWSRPLQWVAAAACALAVGIPVALLHDRSAAPAVITAQADDTPTQIADDNTLLLSVNVALGGTDPSPFSEYRLADTSQNSSQITSKGHPESRTP